MSDAGLGEVELFGTVAVLNVGEGDLKISFNSDDPADVIRAKRIIKDMLRRGYALLIETEDGKHARVHEFDENTCEYIIADFDPDADDDEPGPTPKKETQAKKKRVAAKNAKGVAVSRTAGG